MSSYKTLCGARWLNAAALFLVLLRADHCCALSFTGVNLAGAEFGESVLPGTYNSNYTYPTPAEVDYFLGKGLNTFRIAFRWERLQRSAGAAFDAAELSRLNNIVNYATTRGAYVVLDPHNYARYFPSPSNVQSDPARAVGTAAVPNSVFGDFWSRLGTQYKNNSRVIFGLMNEPNSMPTEQWRDAANTAIAAIRTAGATNLVLVPGNAWTGAHSWNDNWYGTPNAQAMLGVIDAGNNYAFDVHQYLDSNSSGGSAQIVSQTIGQQRLVNFTNWLHANNRRGFLGEFAVANSTIGAGGTQIGDEAIHNMLNYVQANQDVWMGWTWWAAGPWWGEYMFTLDPTNLGQPSQADRPTLGVLQQHLAVKGDYNGNGSVDAADYVAWRKFLDQNITAGTAADGDGNGIVDSVDYSIWRQNFGRARVAAGEATVFEAVPEPTDILSVRVIAFLLFATLRGRQGRLVPEFILKSVPFRSSRLE
jgi:endoglucanase